MTKRERIEQLLEEHGLLRAREVESHGISQSYLAKLADQGVVQRLSRGVYASADHTPTEHHDLVVVQTRVPDAVFCLRTALAFHEMTTQIPGEVDIALERGHATPQLDWPPLNVVQVAEDQFDAGIETHETREGPSIRVYSSARTVVDCFKFRNRLGLDVAVEALRDALARDTVEVEELMSLADTCRVRTVIRPYLEALL